MIPRIGSGLTASLLAVLLFSCPAHNKHTPFWLFLLNPASGSGSDSTPGNPSLTVSVSNLRNKGLTESGVVVGTASGTDLSAVEVSLDGGVYCPAAGTTSWSFELPTGSSTWKQGSQHTVALRAKDSHGLFSSVSTITIRKGINKDINGDGYADVAIGAYAYSSTGRAYIFLSSGAAGVSNTSASGANTIITGESNTNFGNAVALGDINGDGYADAVVGASGYSGSTGRVYVFLSSGSGGITATSSSSANTIITGIAANDALGSSIALGDINGDGYADVVIGACTIFAGGTGWAYVFLSSGTGGVTITSASSATAILTGESSSVFGISVALGDINGDGYADILVGAQTYSSQTGRTYVFLSSGSSGISNKLASAANTIITGESTSSGFGSSVALGDINGDGYADILVGAQTYSSQSGRTYVFLSSGSGGISNKLASAANTIITGGSTSSGFGSSVVLGDINGDGYSDVVVGASAYSTQTGRAYVFLSSGVGGITVASVTSADTIITGEGTNNSFGSSVALGDINGDGYADAVVGASSYSGSTGRAYVFMSSGSGGLVATSASSANAIFTGQAAGYFGGSIAQGKTGQGYERLSYLQTDTFGSQTPPRASLWSLVSASRLMGTGGCQLELATFPLRQT